MKRKTILGIVVAMAIVLSGILPTLANETINYNLVSNDPVCMTSKNLIAIPLNTDITTASELMEAIGPNCDAVNRWNPEKQAWEGWISLFGGMGTNFQISPYEAYEVSVTQDTRFSITGTQAEIVLIYLIKPENGVSKNYIALPKDTTITNAKELLNAIPNCDTVNRWNPETQAWEGYINAFGGIGTNFAIQEGEGYLVTVTTNTVWMPT